MGRYIDRRNFIPHNINKLTILINDEHKLEGLDMFEAELDEDEVTMTKVASGLACFAENPSLTGVVRINFLEASASTDILYTLSESGASFAISAFDESAPNFKVNAQFCRIQKRPVLSRTGEPTISEWLFVCGYLDIKGGSYAIATV